MRSAKYYKVRTVVRAVFWLALLAGLYLIATSFWWNGTDWCIGSLVECGL
jgi:uncharacterized membrane protein